jgi:hypothetical protein
MSSQLAAASAGTTTAALTCRANRQRPPHLRRGAPGTRPRRPHHVRDPAGGSDPNLVAAAPYLSAAFEPERAFETGLELLVGGLDHLLATSRPAVTEERG